VNAAPPVRQAALQNSIRLALQSKGKNEEDEIVIYHDANGADMNSDSDLDAAKLPLETHYSEISVNGAEDILAIKALPSYLNDVVIPLTVKTTSSGLHTISVKDVNLVREAILWDKLTDTKTRITAETSYLFEAEAGLFGNRFVLLVGAPARKISDASLTANLQDNALSIFGGKLEGAFRLVNTQGQTVFADEFQDGNFEYHSSRPITLPKGYYTLVTTSGSVKLINR
jgi:hypothetical protein